MLADIADDSQQELANAVFSIWLAVGNITGYVAGFIPWQHAFSALQTDACGEGCTSLRICFVIAMSLVIITCTITITSAKEKPLAQAPPGMYQLVHLMIIKDKDFSFSNSLSEC